ncbi:helix-turn-helix domain-containing protein, partial [Candidatus Saccharibacteria bacterium]|nr:helix-turn-helix domain-containing protein [Candidatus Saccharibacteria bacterium]
MIYLTVEGIAKKWGISDRSVRNYCTEGRIEGAKLANGVWRIPENSQKPERINQKQSEDTLLDILRFENKNGLKGGIYHKVQIELTYNSNHIEGSRLTEEQTRYIFETNTVGMMQKFKGVRADDVVET